LKGSKIMKNLYPHLFQPLEIRGKVLKNRIFSAPNMLFQVVNGRPTDYYVGYLEHKARGGAAVVTLGEVPICDGGSHTPPIELIPENLNIFGEMSSAIKEHGALACVELTHGGRRARQHYNKKHLIGPVTEITELGAFVREMTRQDMEDVADAYANAAAFMLDAGFDIAHIHAGHSWLFPQFLSPIINKRTDEFGGSLENRMRFPLMCLKRIREKVGNRMLVSMRMSGSERIEGGFTPEDVAVFLQQSEPYIDFVEITTERWELCMPSTYIPRSTNVELSAAIKATGLVKMPIFVIGSILEPEEAEEIIASGKADGVSMSRALIADPCLPKKARSGKADDIIPCLRCMHCTMNDNAVRHFECSVNPTTAHETRLGFMEELGEAKFKRNVLVIGGGPAGMLAAVTASQRGHNVTLCEKTGHLGGIIRYADYDSLKPDLRRYKNYLVRQVEKSNVRVLLNTEGNQALVDEIKPDHIIVAAGSVPKVPSFIKGYELAHDVLDLYFKPETVKGDNIVIIGGGLSGVEAGLHLRTQGKNVTVIELFECLSGVGMTYRRGVEYAIEKYGLTMLNRTSCSEITEEGVKCTDAEGNELFIPADSVFYCIGMTSNRKPYFELAQSAEFVDIVGDCRSVGTVCGTTHSAYSAAVDIGMF